MPQFSLARNIFFWHGARMERVGERILEDMRAQVEAGSTDPVLLAIVELYGRTNLLRRVLAGLTGYMLKGWDDLRDWMK